ncbi:hypothetical protein FB451DRAFT_1171221 [Mycena latifolia]|nr:hypothetical protein FB451DRAFT_1171221 [Mycena latifolia]
MGINIALARSSRTAHVTATRAANKQSLFICPAYGRMVGDPYPGRNSVLNAAPRITMSCSRVTRRPNATIFSSKDLTVTFMPAPHVPFDVGIKRSQIVGSDTHQATRHLGCLPDLGGGEGPARGLMGVSDPTICDLLVIKKNSPPESSGLGANFKASLDCTGIAEALTLEVVAQIAGSNSDLLCKAAENLTCGSGRVRTCGNVGTRFGAFETDAGEMPARAIQLYVTSVRPANTSKSDLRTKFGPKPGLAGWAWLRKSQTRALGPLKPCVGPGLAWPGLSGPGLSGLRASGQATGITRDHRDRTEIREPGTNLKECIDARPSMRGGTGTETLCPTISAMNRGRCGARSTDRGGQQRGL